MVKWRQNTPTKNEGAELCIYTYIYIMISKEGEEFLIGANPPSPLNTKP